MSSALFFAATSAAILRSHVRRLTAARILG